MNKISPAPMMQPRVARADEPPRLDGVPSCEQPPVEAGCASPGG